MESSSILNSQLVTNAADSLAAELLRGAESNDAQLVDELYLRAFGRSPAQEETRRALSFLEQVAATASGPATAGTTPGGPSAAAPAKPADARRQAWTWLCQSILSSNEFIYVR